MILFYLCSCLCQSVFYFNNNINHCILYISNLLVLAILYWNTHYLSLWYWTLQSSSSLPFSNIWDFPSFFYQKSKKTSCPSSMQDAGLYRASRGTQQPSLPVPCTVFKWLFLWLCFIFRIMDCVLGIFQNILTPVPIQYLGFATK